MDIIRGLFRPVIPLRKLGTISQPHPGFCSAKYCIKFLCFAPHVRLPQVPGGRALGPLPHRLHALLVAAAFKMDSVIRGAHEVACASSRQSISSL